MPYWNPGFSGCASKSCGVSSNKFWSVAAMDAQRWPSAREDWPRRCRTAPHLAGHHRLSVTPFCRRKDKWRQRLWRFYCTTLLSSAQRVTHLGREHQLTSNWALNWNRFLSAIRLLSFRNQSNGFSMRRQFAIHSSLECFTV